jgi:hypothetical protein
MAKVTSVDDDREGPRAFFPWSVQRAQPRPEVALLSMTGVRYLRTLYLHDM